MASSFFLIFIVMIKMTDIVNETDLTGVEFVSPDETEIDYYDDLNRLEIESGLYIKSYKELNILALRNGKVIGALYGGIRGDTFEFDIIVDKKERGKGIGAKLTDFGIEEYKAYRDVEDYKLELDVVNPDMVHFLLKKGFQKKTQYSNHVIMIYDPSVA